MTTPEKTTTYITLIRWDRPTAGPTVSMASDRALTLLAPRLGPTSTLFLHRFARRNARLETIGLDQLAGEFGITPGVMVKTMNRMVRFDFARWLDDDHTCLEVATELGAGPPPSDGGTPAHVQPPHLRAA